MNSTATKLEKDYQMSISSNGTVNSNGQVGNIRVRPPGIKCPAVKVRQIDRPLLPVLPAEKKRRGPNGAFLEPSRLPATEGEKLAILASLRVPATAKVLLPAARSIGLPLITGAFGDRSPLSLVFSAMHEHYSLSGKSPTRAELLMRALADGENAGYDGDEKYETVSGGASGSIKHEEIECDNDEYEDEYEDEEHEVDLDAKEASEPPADISAIRHAVGWRAKLNATLDAIFACDPIGETTAIDKFQRLSEDYIRHEIRESLSSPQTPVDGGLNVFTQVTERLEKLHRALGSDEGNGRFRVWSAAELDAADLDIGYVVPGLLAEHSLCGLAGPKKSLKTTLSIAASLAIAANEKVFDHFTPTRSFKVVNCVGEGGLRIARAIARRAAKELGFDSLAEVPNWSLVGNLPRIDRPDDWQEFLSRVIDEHNPEVLGLDPLYVMYGGEEAGSVFKMGTEVYGQLIELCKSRTVIVSHHMRSVRPSPHDRPDLDDAAYAGFAESVGQWWLFNRRERYVDGSGQHKLWLSVGGREGHDSGWTLDVDEGDPEQPAERKLTISLSPARDGIEAERRQKKAASKEKEDREREQRERCEEAKVVGELAKLPGRRANRSALAGLAIKNKTTLEGAIQRLKRSGRVNEVPISKSRSLIVLVAPPTATKEKMCIKKTAVKQPGNGQKKGGQPPK